MLDTSMARRLYAGALVICFAGCSSASQNSVVPSKFSSAPFKAPAAAKIALLSNGGTMHGFSEAANASLTTDDEYGAFVDPQVAGADRQLAIRLLKIMPPSLRGDFVYVDGMKVLSNRVELTSGIRFVKPGDPQTQLPSRGAASGVRKQLNYPPLGGLGGPYLRNYSAQGVNAAIGYATVPCDSILSGADNGFMYFNSYTADSSGSIVDAGLSVDAALRVHPFINEGAPLYTAGRAKRTILGRAGCIWELCMGRSSGPASAFS